MNTYVIDTTAWPLLVWSGLAAIALSTWLLMAFRKLGATTYLPRAYWSCALFGSVGNAALIFAGLFRMVIMIAVVPVLYTAVFAYTGRAETLTGATVGLVHGALSALLLPLAARRCSGARSPGVMGWHLGRATPLVLLVVHAAYGALLGYIYVNG